MTTPMLPARPARRPMRPQFSSGPCPKRPGWTASQIRTDMLGRSHRSSLGKARLGEAIVHTRALLGVPADYRIGIVPASDTGAVEMAMWSMLGLRGVDMLAWESFGAGWVTDAAKQLKLDPLQIFEAPYGTLPDLSQVDPEHDVVFTWNGTTSGVRVPNADWISPGRGGLTICDATSAAFAQALDWPKLDVTTFSWQKVLGGEAAHGMLILSPRAVERLETYVPPRPLPKIFRLTKGGKLIEGIFKGETINTPSMWCVEDYLDALAWADALGGRGVLFARADANLAAVAGWVERTPWIEFLCADPAWRSNTSVCLKITEPSILRQTEEKQKAFVKRVAGLLENEGVAYDIAGYRDAPPGLRIWCGATVERADLEALLPWLEWAFAAALAEMQAAA